MRNFILDLLSYALGTKIFYNFNLNVIKLSSVFIGNNNFYSMKTSGELFFLKNIFKEKPDLCIDVGANEGSYSKYILENSSFKIIAFEPFSKSFKRLNKLKKKYPKRIDLFNFRLGNANRNLSLHYDKGNSLWSNFNPEVNKIDYLKDNKFIERSKIEKLDKIYYNNKKLFKNKIKLLKIDTEGYEYEVLLGVSEFYQEKKPTYTQIENNYYNYSNYVFKLKNV